MIKGKCFTNLDGYNGCYGFPEVFVEVPRIGDRIESETGQKLRVVSITHKVRKREYGEYSDVPYVLIELHK